jgi:hypothetical protein
VTHDEIQDRLEAYVDDRLTREERRAMDAHLEQCDECREILDEVAPVDVSALGPTRFDSAAMKRTVRRSMFRTAVNTALLLLAGWIVVFFLSALVIQPLVVNRGDRAADAVRMSMDLTQMLNPGLVLTDGRIESGLLSRDVSLDYALPVGAGLRPTPGTSITIGVLGISESSTADPRFPVVDEWGVQTDARDRLEHLGDGTVATVVLRYESPLTVEASQQAADDPAADVRVIWAGFDASLGREFGPTWTAAGSLGYGTCSPGEPLPDEMLGATSAGFGGVSLFSRASIDRALDAVIAALENIDSRPELVSYVVGPFDDDPGDVALILDELRTDPLVNTLVVTGPTPSVTEFVTAATESGATAEVMAVDFYNWTDGLCGR